MLNRLYYLVATYEDGQYFISCVDDDPKQWIRSKEVYYFEDYAKALEVFRLVRDSGDGVKSIQVLNY